MKKNKKSFTEQDINNLKIKIKSIKSDALIILSYSNLLLSSASNMEWRIEFRDLDCNSFKTLEDESDYCSEVLKEVLDYLINK